jgi:hypothetical protein
MMSSDYCLIIVGCIGMMRSDYCPEWGGVMCSDYCGVYLDDVQIILLCVWMIFLLSDYCLVYLVDVDDVL